jgi:hypothetical protein
LTDIVEDLGYRRHQLLQLNAGERHRQSGAEIHANV